MSDVFKDIPQGGGGFFKPESVVGCAAMMIEVKSFQRQRPGNFGPKDAVLADVTVFQTAAELEAGQPTSVSFGQVIDKTYLVRDLEPLVGSATVTTLGQSKPKSGQKPAWIFNAPAADVKAKVIAYYKQREAAVADAIADAPDFE